MSGEGEPIVEPAAAETAVAAPVVEAPASAPEPVAVEPAPEPVVAAPVLDEDAVRATRLAVQRADYLRERGR